LVFTAISAEKSLGYTLENKPLKTKKFTSKISLFTGKNSSEGMTVFFITEIAMFIVNN
jgi:hypothetical protein